MTDVGLITRKRDRSREYNAMSIQVNVTRASSDSVRAGRPQFSRLLAEMQEAHERLLRAMADLDRLTRGPLPTKKRIIDARWAISRASLARRKLWGDVYAHLLGRVSKEDEADLRRLQEADRALLRSSTGHVSTWRIDAVMQNWPAYCVASNAIRWKMKAAIGAEKRLLYPMLGA